MTPAACPHCQRTLPEVGGGEARFCLFCGGALCARDDALCQTMAPVTPPPSPQPSATPLSIPGYELIRLIGAGNMGQVYEALELETGRRVALKCLNRNLQESESHIARFLREAQLPAKISHPNVTFVFGAFEHGGRLYIVMELMAGQSLETVIREQGKLPPERAVDLILDVVAGLDAAHRMSVIHRDVKPSNCFLHSDGSVKVGDFGLSKSLVDQSPDVSVYGSFMGTLAYAAPEQLKSGTIDRRADIYAVGATLFHLLTGRPPFLGDAILVSTQIIEAVPPSVLTFSPEVPRDLAEIVNRCLTKTPEGRFQSMGQLRAALLPFASYGAKRATLGRRLAAFMVDYFVIAMTFKILLFVSMLVVALSAYQATNPMSMAPLVWRIWLGISVLGWVAATLYFGVGDGWGATWGKRLMRLRVVNRQGESPGLVRGLVRAVALPGCFGITLVWPIYQATSAGTSIDAPFQILSGFSSMFVYLIPTLVILSTMTLPNQLRGIHEIMSGTRVIGVATSRMVDEEFPIYEPLAFSVRRETFGPYHTKSVLAQLGDRTVHLADDVQLHRELWIITGTHRAAPSIARIHLARVSRQRWLGGGLSADGQRWDAYEAIEGVPLQVLMGSCYPVDWRILQMTLQDCATELLAALDDGTLPDALHLGSVWVDRQGHAKLLDEPFSDPVPRNPFETAPAREASYHQVFCDVVDLVFQHPNVPISAQRFRDQFRKLPPTRESLEWARDQVTAMGQRTLVLDMEHRAGVMGVTLGFEWAVYSLLAGLIFMAAFFMLPWSFTLSFLTALSAMAVVVGLAGWVFRGGFAFWIMQVVVCSRGGQPVSPWRGALRSIVSWLPALYVHGLLIIGWILLFDVIHGVNMATLLETNSNVEDYLPMTMQILRNPWLMAGFVGTFLIVGVVLLYGLYYSVVRSPARGLADVVVGTRLVPY